jgi:hypothetical protein
VSLDWNAPATVHRTEGEVRTAIADGPLSAMVERFLAEPEDRRPHLLLTVADEDMDLAVVQGLHRRADFPGAF